MKKALILGGIVVVIGVMTFLSIRQNIRKGTKVYEEEARQVATLVATVKATGEIQPKVYVNISSQVPGQIVELRVKEGDRVKRGEVLVQLDPRQYRSTVTRLEANLRVARINLERERTSLATYENTLRRQEALAKEQIVSSELLDQARLQVDTSRITVRSLEEQIQQAEADLVKARDELSKTTLRAPMDGLVTRVNAKLGEQVIIGTMNNPGTVILVLSDMSELLAEVRVDETEVAAVRPGQTAVVTVDALERRKFDGVVSEIAHTATRERDVSRFVVKVSLSPEPDAGGPPAAHELPRAPAETGVVTGSLALLRPGMTAHAAVQVASASDVLVVPLQAVISRKRKELEETVTKAAATAGDSSTGSNAAEPAGTRQDGSPGPAGPAAGSEEDVDVVLVDRDGKVTMIPVRTGLSDEFNVELVGSDVKPGDKVIIGPYRTLKKLKHGEAVVKVDKDEDLKEQS